MPLKIVKYARLSCGCTLDFTESEAVAFGDVLDRKTFDCPKHSAHKAVYIMATWAPTEQS
jgi:hypothetical protein